MITHELLVGKINECKNAQDALNVAYGLSAEPELISALALSAIYTELQIISALMLDAYSDRLAQQTSTPVL